MVTVKFTPEEEEFVIELAFARQTNALERHRPPKGGIAIAGPEPEKAHLIGAKGHCGYAKLTGVPLDMNTLFRPAGLKVNGFKFSPFDPVQTYSTERKTGYEHLVLWEDDPEYRRFVLNLVSLTDPYVTIVGWMDGKEAKQQKYWSNQSNPKKWRFWVPRADLHDQE